MAKYRQVVSFIICLVVCCVAQAREQYVKPQWYVGKSDFREAVIDKDGYLIDSYSRAHSDTVNVIDLKTHTDYSLNISFRINNLHGESLTKFPQYEYNDKGKVKRVGKIERPIYGWVWGMKDMLHYNAVWMRASENDDALYDFCEVQFCVVTVNDKDTTYHVNWRYANFTTFANNANFYNMWIHTDNNTVWIGGGLKDDIPWATVYNVPSFGSLTGLYLGSASKVRVGDFLITVEDKDELRHTNWTRSLLNDYFSTSEDILEGFWRITSDKNRWGNVLLGGNYDLAIVANGDGYDILYLSGADIYPGKWREGTVKGSFKRSNSRFYEGYWYDAEGVRMDKVYLNLLWNRLVIEFGTENISLNMLPTKSVRRIKKPDVIQRTQGTGFALTSDGYIVTNHHVVDGGYEFYIHSDASLGQPPYRAEVVVTDSLHDLAILHINDSSFTTLGEIPYSFSTDDIRAGEEIFYLGYPRATIIGGDVKYSMGNVSAINGLALHQFMMSVDIDHGSSGSPVFNTDGNVVGVASMIINEDVSRLTASYAIKLPYLYRLIERLPSPIALPENKIKELSQPDKIEAITPYTFIIEVLKR